ncbi:hypothetical protein HYPSUDRAFT_204607 [Hypholoma sublateritium FD-334 SS-4]|uniref:Uncharacterized protein n=1 Tax=Hypholoma sublateritium (strain FD-334 SS-4) TaxID=945553 RepID=A0A0D2PH09_HYPSF|nr:hypothetical protein HYPSUDRAFT_204607 [Hypholoma sublateritium FD-334 SS-4]
MTRGGLGVRPAQHTASNHGGRWSAEEGDAPDWWNTSRSCGVRKGRANSASEEAPKYDAAAAGTGFFRRAGESDAYGDVYLSLLSGFALKALTLLGAPRPSFEHRTPHSRVPPVYTTHDHLLDAPTFRDRTTPPLSSACASASARGVELQPMTASDPTPTPSPPPAVLRTYTPYLLDALRLPCDPPPPSIPAAPPPHIPTSIATHPAPNTHELTPAQRPRNSRGSLRVAFAVCSDATGTSIDTRNTLDALVSRLFRHGSRYRNDARCYAAVLAGADGFKHLLQPVATSASDPTDSIDAPTSHPLPAHSWPYPDEESASSPLPKVKYSGSSASKAPPPARRRGAIFRILIARSTVQRCLYTGIPSSSSSSTLTLRAHCPTRRRGPRWRRVGGPERWRRDGSASLALPRPRAVVSRLIATIPALPLPIIGADPLLFATSPETQPKLNALALQRSASSMCRSRAEVPRAAAGSAALAIYAGRCALPASSARLLLYQGQQIAVSRQISQDDSLWALPVFFSRVTSLNMTVARHPAGADGFAHPRPYGATFDAADSVEALKRYSATRTADLHH